MAIVPRSAVLVAIALAMAACAGLTGPQVIAPPGLAHRMAPDAAIALVRAEDAHGRAVIGRVLRAFAITRIELVPANTTIPVKRADGAVTDASFSQDGTVWAIEADGTFAHCGSTCTPFSRDLFIVDDATGEIVGVGAREDPVGPDVPGS